MHFPKASLFRRGFRSTRYECRARMGSFVREMTKDVYQALAERLPQPRNHKAQAPAIGAQIVAIDDDAYDAARCIAAAHMIARMIDGALEPGLSGERSTLVSHRLLCELRRSAGSARFAAWYVRQGPLRPRRHSTIPNLPGDRSLR